MCYVQKDRNTIFVATHKKLYHARVTPDNQKEAALATVDINLLHRCMGHISTNHIQHMVKSGQLQGIDTLVGTPIFCEACVLGKMKKLPFESQEEPHTTRPFEMVHTDVGGPIGVGQPAGLRQDRTAGREGAMAGVPRHQARECRHSIEHSLVVE